MIKHAFVIVFIVLVACIMQTPPAADSVSFPALFPEIIVPAQPVVNAKARPGDTIAFAAIDRECGSCHHGDRSTNTGALEIFDLRDTCWYCPLTPEQGKSLKGRISGSAFTDLERTAIVALIAHLAEDDDSTH